MSQERVRRPKKLTSFQSIKKDIAKKDKSISLTHIESLHEISSSSTRDSSEGHWPPDQGTLELMVRDGLHQIQLAANSDDVDTLLPLLMPKIFFELQVFQRLQRQVQELSQTLHSYTQHANSLDQDIADVYLDIHNIFIELNKLNGQTLTAEQADRIEKRLMQTEQLKERSKHIINREPLSFTTLQANENEAARTDDP